MVEWLRELIPPSPCVDSASPQSEDRLPGTTRIGLAGVTGFGLALLLAGTLRYATRFETSRAIASPRYSALPTAERVREALHSEVDASSATGPIELLFDQRADVIVLLTVLAFLTLARHRASRSPVSPLKKEPDPNGTVE